MTESRRVQRPRDVKPRGEIVYYTMPYLASLMVDEKTGKRWQTQRTRRWLQREGACYLKGSRYVATAETLIGSFPELLNKIRRDES